MTREVSLDTNNALDQHGDELDRRENPTAGNGARLGAAVVDRLLLVLPLIPTFLAAWSLFVAARTSTADYWGMVALDRFMDATGLIGLAVLLVVVCIQWWLAARRGQSIGKKALGLHVVCLDHPGPPGFFRAVVLRE